MNRRLVEILSCLTDKEKQVIVRRFGLNGECETLEKIGKDFNTDRERIRQWEAKALRKIRKYIKLLFNFK